MTSYLCGKKIGFHFIDEQTSTDNEYEDDIAR